MKLLLYHSSQHENQEQEAGSTTGAVVTHKQHVTGTGPDWGWPGC